MDPIQLVPFPFFISCFCKYKQTDLKLFFPPVSLFFLNHLHLRHCYFRSFSSLFQWVAVFKQKARAVKKSKLGLVCFFFFSFFLSFLNQWWKATEENVTTVCIITQLGSFIRSWTLFLSDQGSNPSKTFTSNIKRKWTYLL